MRSIFILFISVLGALAVVGSVSSANTVFESPSVVSRIGDLVQDYYDQLAGVSYGEDDLISQDPNGLAEEIAKQFVQLANDPNSSDLLKQATRLLIMNDQIYRARSEYAQWRGPLPDLLEQRLKSMRKNRDRNSVLATETLSRHLAPYLARASVGQSAPTMRMGVMRIPGEPNAAIPESPMSKSPRKDSCGALLTGVNY